MDLAIGLAIGIFVLLWVWITYEIKHAPEYNEFGIKIDEDDINKDLFGEEEEVL